MVNLPACVRDYFELMDTHPRHFCKEQFALRKQITKVFECENVRFEAERYEKYINLGKYLGFGTGFEWERLLIGLFLCTYRQDGLPRWNRLLCYMGRGNGKDGIISWMSLALISPFNPVKNYNVDIAAFNETQALRPVKDVRTALNSNETLMKKRFYWTKEIIQCRKSGSELKGWANNSKGLDGLRSGAVFLDEIHTYENAKTIEVFKSGLGKVEDARLGFFTTDGYVQDGPLDQYLKDGKECLLEEKPDDGWLYFICKLDSEDEADDEDAWIKANPSLPYKKSLLQEVRDHHKDWKKSPALNKDFLCKRMNLKQVQAASPVASYEQIMATDRPLPDLRNKECTVGVDFSKTTDWAAVNFHFKEGENRFDINHAFICMQSEDLWRLKCPYREWAEKGQITLVDGPEIPPKLIAQYIKEQALKNGWYIRCVAIDSFRFTLMSEALEEAGFSTADKTVYLIRPSDQVRIAPVIIRCFANRLMSWGNTPHLRWATNNACLVPAKASTLAKSGELDIGNYLFGKQEPHARKTDPFMALVASVIIEDRLSDAIVELDDSVPMVFSF